jgi:protein O-GlcNAc transferase
VTLVRELEALASLYRSGQLAEVIRLGETYVRNHPNLVALHNMLGGAYLQLQRTDQAKACFENALRLQPKSAAANNNLGIVQKELGKPDAALACFKRAMKADPAYLDAHLNMGAALCALGRYGEALQAYSRAINLKPDSADAHNNLAATLRLLGRHEEAAEAFNRAIAVKPNFPEAYAALGATLSDLGRREEAVGAIKRAIQLRPDFAEAYNLLGATLKRLGHRNEAIECFNRAVRLKPDFAESYNNLGVTLQEVGRRDEAIACYQQALRAKPDYAKAYNNLGTTLQEMGRRPEAIECYAQALAIDPHFAVARVNKMHQQAHICDWSERESDAAIIPYLGVTGEAVSPFAMLLREDHPARHRIRAERFAKAQFPPRATPAFSPPRARPEKLRIGYFSADFHNHATMFLMARLFETHDRDRFSLRGYSFGAEKDDEMRARVRTAFDAFHDVRTFDDKAIAELARNDGIDIAVDLKGYSEGSRAGIFAHRAAPIQINFLGYPGTMGAPFIDYLIADRVIIPGEQRAHYSESIITVPNCYQVNDDRRAIAERAPSRAELGLPERGFVFCCFNNTFKVTAAEFNIWMRLLSKVEGSVLWLLAANPWAEANLKREAQARGVDPERLVFAPITPLPEHLARCRVADLFLDTFDCNAHTTASDALWVGLPVLTKLGQGLIARVAGSLLTAIDVPELITTDAASYEALALNLATDPEKLQRLRTGLAANRTTTPLFDSTRSTSNLERAFDAAYARYIAGQAPADISISEDAGQ